MGSGERRRYRAIVLCHLSVSLLVVCSDCAQSGIKILTDSTNDGRLSVVLGGNVIRVQGTEPLQVGGGGGIGGIDHCEGVCSAVGDEEKKRRDGAAELFDIWFF